ncbi:MAG TPA: hypothetical protein VHN12_11930 [Geobacteraceae bacterium]|nr:hypothetical protein [Geobacteraceae bacterium]
MKTFLQFILLSVVVFLSFGCASHYYNVPRETFEKKVKILGVAPIFVDSESDIRHPEKDALVALIKECNRKNEKELVARLKDTGTFFSVRLLDDDADKLFYNILFRRERRDDASVIYNKHFYKLPELKELVTRNGVDAVMFLVVSGLTRQNTVRSSNLVSYLESNYNSLVMTSQIFDAEGNILWEFPNFRENRPSLPVFFELQYPDFDEAKANETDKVDVKFKTIPGITRALNKAEGSSLQGNAKVSSAYASIFSDMASLLKPEKKFLWWKKKDEKKDEQPVQETPKPETARPEAVKEEAVKPESLKPETIKEEAIKPSSIKEETIK